MIKRIALPFLLAALAGCTWVTPSPEAMQADIKVVDQSKVADCQKLAMNVLKVADHLGTLQRMPGDVDHDLQVMAINQAAIIGADTVSALGPVDQGSQGWGLYRCDGSPAPAASNTQAPADSTGLKTLPYTPPR
jgi:hypothetical protein